MAPRPNKKIVYRNIAAEMRSDVHGYGKKDLIILHETVSSDITGWDDILGNAAYLDKLAYGIHGLTDAEGHIAWALGLGDAVFYQAGGVNTRGIGIEQVSRVMLESPINHVRSHIWALRVKQLRATAQLIAAAARGQGWPYERLVYSDALHPGITSHWDVSRHFKASLGHTDCFPVHKGGYYPILAVINMAKAYYRLGYHL
jgi:hypothetical protein